MASIPARPTQLAMYEQAVTEYAAALGRLARGYEMDSEKRRDLLQEIHLALWRSFAGFDERCSIRTWVYRVAHNAATSYVLRQKRSASQLLIGLDELDLIPEARDREGEAGQREQLARVIRLLQRLKPLDRQVILSYLEGFDGLEIAEVTGLSARNVATKIHRIKGFLARQFQQESSHAE